MSEYIDAFWDSPDGLKLHYRDYAGTSERPPVLCLPGLTRNARDFADLAERLAAAGWRVLCPDMRGRGDSDYSKNASTYHPMQYVADVNALLEQIGVDRFVVVGTSLGGLMAMVLAMVDARRIAGALINDIGPVLETGGVGRIRDTIGQARSFPTWMHAARELQDDHGAAFPDYTLTDWLALAKRVMVLGSNGRIVYDYDMKIAEPFEKSDAVTGLDLWPGWMALAGRPVLVVRGGLSDILSGETLSQMTERLPEAEAITLDRIGHPPSLNEPEAVAAIDRWLARIG